MSNKYIFLKLALYVFFFLNIQATTRTKNKDISDMTTKNASKITPACTAVVVHLMIIFIFDFHHNNQHTHYEG